jgi:3-oxoadipate enol-lactonase/4-carboxymuconolactone decarboxylase
MPDLLSVFRVLRMDTRGHGASDAPAIDYTLRELASDLAAVMKNADVRRATVAGVSLGGMIAMELALAEPACVSSLILICTSASMDRSAWTERVKRVRDGGTAAIADLAMTRFLAPEFVQSNPEIADSLRRGLVNMSAAGYAGAAAAIRDMSLIDRISAITAPTLVIAGARDVSTPFQGHGDRIAAAIPSAKIARLDSAHLAPLEVPTKLVATIRSFLTQE